MAMHRYPCGRHAAIFRSQKRACLSAKTPFFAKHIYNINMNIIFDYYEFLSNSYFFRKYLQQSITNGPSHLRRRSGDVS
jgi:hypothetical protein